MRSYKLVIVLIIAFLVCISGATHAQIIFQPKPVEYNFKGVVYKTEKVFEGRVTTSGLVLGYKTGILKSYYNTSFYNFEFGYIKDPRERRQNKNFSFPSNGLSPSFTYGKRNSFWQLRLSAGGKKYLSEKTKRRGIAVGFSYEGGATIGLLKPVYLQVIQNNTETFQSELVEISYSEENAEQFLAYDDIYGASSFTKGLSETNITVGAHGKIAAHFAMGAFEDRVKALEAGLMVDIFPGKVHILAEREGVKNSFYFLNLYLSFQFGRRK